MPYGTFARASISSVPALEPIELGSKSIANILQDSSPKSDPGMSPVSRQWNGPRYSVNNVFQSSITVFLKIRHFNW